MSSVPQIHTRVDHVFYTPGKFSPAIPEYIPALFRALVKKKSGFSRNTQSQIRDSLLHRKRSSLSARAQPLKYSLNNKTRDVPLSALCITSGPGTFLLSSLFCLGCTMERLRGSLGVYVCVCGASSRATRERGNWDWLVCALCAQRVRIWMRQVPSEDAILRTMLCGAAFREKSSIRGRFGSAEGDGMPMWAF